VELQDESDSLVASLFGDIRFGYLFNIQTGFLFKNPKSGSKLNKTRLALEFSLNEV
jgi:hypothetical protein